MVMVFNFKDYQYMPCFKTKDGEIKAYSNLSSNVKKSTLPLVELTRGRKSKKDQVGLIEKRTKKFKSLFEGNPFILRPQHKGLFVDLDYKNCLLSAIPILFWAFFFNMPEFLYFLGLFLYFRHTCPLKRVQADRIWSRILHPCGYCGQWRRCRKTSYSLPALKTVFWTNHNEFCKPQMSAPLLNV